MQKELQLQFGPTNKWGQHFSKRNLVHTARTLAPTLAALVFASAAHAQGTMDFTGATTLMTTFKTPKRMDSGQPLFQSHEARQLESQLLLPGYVHG